MDDLSLVNFGGNQDRFNGGCDVINSEVDGSEIGYLSIAVVADVGESVGADVCGAWVIGVGSGWGGG